MSQPDVILVGASVRSLAESAIRDGLRPACVDMFVDADLVAVIGLNNATENSHQLVRMQSFDELPSLLSRFDGNVPIVICGGLENHPHVLEQLFARHTVASPKMGAISAVRDPRMLFPALRSAGCSVPAWHRLADWTAANGATHQLHGQQQSGDNIQQSKQRWLLKNVRSSGGMSVSWLDEAAGELLSDQPGESADFIVQEYIEGVPISATFLRDPSGHAIAAADFGEVAHSQVAGPETGFSSNGNSDTILLGASLQLSGQPQLNAIGFQFCGSAGPVQLAPNLKRQVMKAGMVVAKFSGLTGIFGIDFIVRDGIAWLLEVNPRITASHELHESSSRFPCGQVSLQLACFGASVSSTHDVLPAERRCDASEPTPKFRESLAVPTVLGGDRSAAKSTFKENTFRFVVYSECDFHVDSRLESQLLAACRASGRSSPVRRAWLADIPSAGSIVKKHWPFCSIYVRSRGSHAISDLQTLLNILPIALPQLSGAFLLRTQRQIDDLESGQNLSNC
ncbi:MAG: ATP-grasp domain-containing protein [Fuerstiella sp.]